MAARFTPAPNLRQLIEELPGVGDDLQERAEAIGDEAVATSPMAQKYPKRYGEVEVTTPAPGKRRVAAKGPMAPIDEWGSANSPPHASMRRAAERHGQFREEG